MLFYCLDNSIACISWKHKIICFFGNGCQAAVAAASAAIAAANAEYGQWSRDVTKEKKQKQNEKQKINLNRHTKYTYYTSICIQVPSWWLCLDAYPLFGLWLVLYCTYKHTHGHTPKHTNKFRLELYVVELVIIFWEWNKLQ